MATITIPKKELKIIIKESVKEVIDQERMKWVALLWPSVSKKDQRDIGRRYGNQIRHGIKTFSPTTAQRKALEKAQKNLENKRTLSYDEFVKKLGFTN